MSEKNRLMVGDQPLKDYVFSKVIKDCGDCNINLNIGGQLDTWEEAGRALAEIIHAAHPAAVGSIVGGREEKCVLCLDSKATNYSTGTAEFKLVLPDRLSTLEYSLFRCLERVYKETEASDDISVYSHLSLDFEADPSGKLGTVYMCLSELTDPRSLNLEWEIPRKKTTIENPSTYCQCSNPSPRKINMTYSHFTGCAICKKEII